MKNYDVIIIGSGPAGMGAAFELMRKQPNSSILVMDKNKYSTGGMRNDCKMNFTFPIGFPLEYWSKESADGYLEKVSAFLKPNILSKNDLGFYKDRAVKMETKLLEIEQTHLGTDGGLVLIKELLAKLEELGIDLALGEQMKHIDPERRVITTSERELGYRTILIAPGRQGFRFLQNTMDTLGVEYVDNIVDIGIRVETEVKHYPIVNDYYDPKFHFPEKVRTFCTNSGNAHVVKENYKTIHGEPYCSVNGHAFSTKQGKNNGLTNFAMLKTVRLTEPLASGQQFAENLGLQAMLLGKGKPLMQRVGDFRMGSRSKKSSFTTDPDYFKPSLTPSICCPGDISLAMPARILRAIWKAMKKLDTIVPGVLHPSTIMYYPEIKLYANKPEYNDDNFNVCDTIYFAGDGAGTSRGITAAWASGIRAAEGMVQHLE